MRVHAHVRFGIDLQLSLPSQAVATVTEHGMEDIERIIASRRSPEDRRQGSVPAHGRRSTRRPLISSFADFGVAFFMNAPVFMCPIFK